MAPLERVTRLLEEAIELAQSEGLLLDDARRLMEHVYQKPPGDAFQEVGGVGITLLVYCGSRGFSADRAELSELVRVLGRDPQHFRDRQNAKAAAGVAEAVPDPDRRS